MLAVVNESTIIVRWTPPDPLLFTNGYIISYTNGEDSGTVALDGGSTDEYQQTDIEIGTVYSISIEGTSDHFSSYSVRITLDTTGETYCTLNT